MPAWDWALACGPASLTPSTSTSIPESPRSIPKKCQSCGACVKACPKHVLSLQPETVPVRLLCRAAEEGNLVSDNCKIGCVGCELCMNACKFDAITMVNHLPRDRPGEVHGLHDVR